jgi:hypothetical protein
MHPDSEYADDLRGSLWWQAASWIINREAER